MPSARAPSSAVDSPARRASRRSREHIRGCLLGGAVGDALGAPVEFMTLSQIRARYGPGGIRDFDIAYGRRGAITDDTQMTLFTAEGLLRAVARVAGRGVCHPPGVVFRAYLRWLHTQGARREDLGSLDQLDGWLITLPELHAPRAPGHTCISALRSGIAGTVEEPLNGSKGCGTVMRAAPIGWLADEDAFALGRDIGALTHGHPSGYLASGALALIVQELVSGASLGGAVEAAISRLVREPEGAECRSALQRAVALARSPDGAAPETVERLGGGWVAEEALAIAVYCSLVAGDDFARGVRLAVNHGGDSDSTGAIAGNILGTLLGEAAIPREWLAELELRSEIEALADDLLVGHRNDDEWRRRYPPW
jgi:ADP-ribosylglycohydrolase